MVAAALGISGKLDILVNNAAIEHNKNVVDLDVAVWRQTLENNLTGPFLMMKAAIPHMIEGGGGSIINVSSLAGVRAVPGGPGYCATKAGLIHLTKQVALDFGKNNVRCNVICPGPARTALLEMNVHPLTEVLHTDLDGVFEAMARVRPAEAHRQPGRHDRPVRLPGERRLQLHDRHDADERRRHPRDRRLRAGRGDLADRSQKR